MVVHARGGATCIKRVPPGSLKPHFHRRNFTPELGTF
uniref:Uncharacterized protein n=1 Tax=Anguilla anguilla TaxID=7936 RepID=A0A0E9X9H6_ANGAN